MSVKYALSNTLDLNLARRADRKLRRFGCDLNRVLSLIVTVRGQPSFIATEDEPVPLPPDDPRIESAVSEAKVVRMKPGLYRAQSALSDLYYAEGSTKAKALAELREDLRYLVCDPVKVRYVAYGRNYVADARPAREGGFWAVVPSLDGASTQGETMDELKYMLIDMTKLYVEEA